MAGTALTPGQLLSAWPGSQCNNPRSLYVSVEKPGKLNDKGRITAKRGTSVTSGNAKTIGRRQKAGKAPEILKSGKSGSRK
jgi:hypothetical protein